MPSRRLVAAALLAAALGGCRADGAGEPARGAGDAEALDTAGAVSGLPRDRIEEFARPMTPEEAAQAGIVDTTIYLENAAPPVAEAVPPDSVRRDTTRRDTTRRDTIRPPSR